MKRVVFRFGKGFVLTAMAIGLSLFWTPAARPAGHLVQKTGWMTALDKDGSVEIDGKGYRLDLTARVQDARGRYVSAAELALPAFVHFQFVYTAEGPVITRLKVDPNARQ